MPWVTVVKDLEVDKWFAVTEDTRIDDDDPQYGPDVHIIPVHASGDHYGLGVHDMTRECCCHPRVEGDGLGRNRIIHSEKVN